MNYVERAIILDISNVTMETQHLEMVVIAHAILNLAGTVVLAHQALLMSVGQSICPMWLAPLSKIIVPL